MEVNGIFFCTKTTLRTSRLSSQKKMIENIIHTYQYTYALQWRNIYFCKMHNTKRGADKKMKSGGGKKKNIFKICQKAV